MFLQRYTLNVGSSKPSEGITFNHFKIISQLEKKLRFGGFLKCMDN